MKVIKDLDNLGCSFAVAMVGLVVVLAIMITFGAITLVVKPSSLVAQLAVALSD